MSMTGAAAFEALLTSERLLTVFRHWNDARGERTVPFRKAIDPVHLGKALRNVWLYERDDDGEFYCRISGESVNTAHNHSIMKQPAREIFGPEYDFPIRQRMDFVLDTPAVLFGRMDRPAENRSVMRISLPFFDQSGRPRCTFGASEYVEPNVSRNGATRLTGQADEIAVFSLPDFRKLSAGSLF